MKKTGTVLFLIELVAAVLLLAVILAHYRNGSAVPGNPAAAGDAASDAAGGIALGADLTSIKGMNISSFFTGKTDASGEVPLRTVREGETFWAVVQDGTGFHLVKADAFGEVLDEVVPKTAYSRILGVTPDHAGGELLFLSGEKGPVLVDAGGNLVEDRYGGLYDVLNAFAGRKQGMPADSFVDGHTPVTSRDNAGEEIIPYYGDDLLLCRDDEGLYFLDTGGSVTRVASSAQAKDDMGLLIRYSDGSGAFVLGDTWYGLESAFPELSSTSSVAAGNSAATEEDTTDTSESSMSTEEDTSESSVSAEEDISDELIAIAEGRVSGIITGDVNVRTDASVSSSLLGTVSNGDVYKVFTRKVDENGDAWYRVQLNDGTLAYVRYDYMSLDIAERQPDAREINVSDEVKIAIAEGRLTGLTFSATTNVRTEATTQSSIAASLPENTVLQLISMTPDENDNHFWFMVRWDGENAGYIREDQISVTETAP